MIKLWKQIVSKIVIKKKQSININRNYKYKMNLFI